PRRRPPMTRRSGAPSYQTESISSTSRIRPHGGLTWGKFTDIVAPAPRHGGPDSAANRVKKSSRNRAHGRSRSITTACVLARSREHQLFDCAGYEMKISLSRVG